MRFAICTTVFLLVTSAVWAADVTGKWVANAPGRGGQTQEITFDFKVSGEQLTGTVTGPRGASEISDGKVSGDEISFSQVREFNGRRMTVLYKGKVSGDEIKFTRQREGGDQPQEFTAKRSS
jgi:hypothetical protein